AREIALPGFDYLEGEHDGYRRMAHGVTHRRRLLNVAPDAWIVVGAFRGSGEHTFAFHYHVAPGIEVSGMERDDTGVVVGAEEAGLLLHLVAARTVTSAELIGGWASRAYGEKKPC